MTYEVVLFKANAGVSREDVISAVAKTQPIIEAFDGFIARQLLEGEDGQWMDLVQWQSLEQAKTAAAEVEQNESLAEAFSVIDFSTVQMLHLDDVAFVGVK